MNYIELLTQEEKVNLCGIMGGRDFKELFKHNEREFQKIRKGFRAKSLTEELALSIAIANVDKPFIASWVNTRVQIWLDEIHENITKLEGEGSAHDIALATTMLDSFFSHDVDLYLKLAGITMDEVSRTELRTTMERIESDRAKEEKDADRIKALEEEKQRLLCQIEDCHQSASLLKTEYEQRIQEIEQEKKDLESSLAAAQEKISELQTSLTVAKSDESSHLSQYDDTDISSLPPVGSEETISLCNVISDYSGQKWLIRFADLSHNGHYHMFHRNEELPPYFSNRDKIFYKDGPSTDGFYGIWSWSAIPNEKDPSKDYIISKYNVNLDAIEIATIPEASSLEELIHLLKDGFVYQPHSRRIMFSLYASKGQYMGILCSIKELNVTNGKVSFAEDCIEVPVYEFNSDNILRLENGLSFYRNAFAGLPNKLYQLKSPLDIVKNIVFSSISWATYKTRGYTRAEYRSFKDFLGAIPVEDIIQRIEAECRCSDSVAKELLDEFLCIAWKYVDGDSLEDDVILSAISASSELQERTKALIRADWEAENIFLSTGMVYHRPNRIAPSMKHEESHCNIVFQRGIGLDSISCVSGIGFYSKLECISNPDGIKTMFGLEQQTLWDLWNSTLTTASWKAAPSLEQNTEYLRLKPPFSRGYWENKPDTTGLVSILRTGIKSSQLYYIYRYSDNAMEISPLPQWQVENHHYRSLACACLHSYGALPPIEYVKDGALVHIWMNYLLPPHELEFVKLYSWPEVCTSLPCDFKRKLSTEVFSAMKTVLSDQGYEFKGEMI